MAKNTEMKSKTIQVKFDAEKKHSVVYKEEDGPHSFYFSKTLFGGVLPLEMTVLATWK